MRTQWILSCVLCVLAAGPASAMRSVGGKDPVTDQRWPVGCVGVANLPTRVSYWQGDGGISNFQYECRSTAEFNDALVIFGAILAPRLELVVMDGPRAPDWGEPKDPVHWDFEIYDTGLFHQLNSSPKSTFMSSAPTFWQPLPTPRLTVYLSKESPVEWKGVLVPETVQVLDRRVETSAYAGSAGGVVRCTAYDMATGKVIPGATLALKQYVDKGWQQKYQVRADERGVAVVKEIAAGNYAVTLSHDGYATRSLAYYRNLGRTLGVFDDARLSPVASVAGSVTDAAGKPLPGVTVRTSAMIGLDGMGYGGDAPQATTDADGRFQLEGLPTGYCSLRLTREDYYYFSFDIQSIPSKELTFRMDRTGSVRGKVRGAERNLDGQEVHLKIDPEGDPIGKWGGSMALAADGTFEVKEIPPGSYHLRAEVSGSPREGRSPFLPNDKQTPVAIQVKPGETLEVEIDLK